MIISIDLVYCVLHILFGIGVLNFLRETEQEALMDTIGAWMIVGDTNRSKTAARPPKDVSQRSLKIAKVAILRE